MVEEALRSNIKRSMKKLSRAIIGDSDGQTLNPLFKVLVVLRQAASNATPKVAQQAL